MILEAEKLSRLIRSLNQYAIPVSNARLMPALGLCERNWRE